MASWAETARTAARQGRALQRQGHSKRGLRDCSEGARAGALEQALGGLLCRTLLLLARVFPVGARNPSLDGSPVDVQHGNHDVEPSSEPQEDRRRSDQVGIPSSRINPRCLRSPGRSSDRGGRWIHAYSQTTRLRGRQARSLGTVRLGCVGGLHERPRRVHPLPNLSQRDRLRNGQLTPGQGYFVPSRCKQCGRLRARSVRVERRDAGTAAPRREENEELLTRCHGGERKRSLGNRLRR